LADGGGGRGIYHTPCKKEGDYLGGGNVHGICPGEYVQGEMSGSVYRYSELNCSRISESGVIIYVHEFTAHIMQLYAMHLTRI